MKYAILHICSEVEERWNLNILQEDILRMRVLSSR